KDGDGAIRQRSDVRSRDGLVWRERPSQWRSDQAALRPAAVIVGRHDGKDTHLANAPDAVRAPDKAVLEDVEAERGRTGAEITEHVELDTARTRLVPGCPQQ